MTDVTVNEAAEAAPRQDIVVTITLPGDVQITVNCSQLEDSPYVAILAAGCEAILRKANGMAKLLAGITKLGGQALEERVAKITEAANKTHEQLKAGQVPTARAKAVKTSGAEQVEAMRLAKNMLKDLIKASGQKVGAYSAKEQTAAAKAILERTPKLYELARKNLADRAAEAQGVDALNLKALFGAKADSEEVKAKPKAPPKKAKKGEEKPTLSAKQAGMVAPRQKPGTHATQH